MTLFIQAARVSQLAKRAGLALGVEQGRYQVQHITYNAKGTSTVTPKTGFVSLAEAERYLLNHHNLV